MNCIIALILLFTSTGFSHHDHEKILIINSFDAQSINARKNKKLLFGELADILKQMLYAELDMKIPAERIIIPGLIRSNGKDSIYFNLTGVEVTREPNGKKSRTASYDIVADIEYTLYSDTTRRKEFETKVWQY